jgi:hypothetical protein
VEQHYSIFLVLLDDVRSNHQFIATFHHEDALLLALFDLVELYLRRARSFASQSDVGSQVFGDMV